MTPKYTWPLDKRRGHAICLARVFRMHLNFYWVHPDRRVQSFQRDCQEPGQGKVFQAEEGYCCFPSKLGLWFQDNYPETYQPRYLWIYQKSMHHVSYRYIHLIKEHMAGIGPTCHLDW